MRLLGGLGGLVVIGVVSGDLGVCDNERRIQLLLVHDGSANYRSLFVSLAGNTEKFMNRLAEEWGPTGIQLGLSAFIDKNMPFKGWGDCCGVGEMDYCYMHHTGPTVDIKALKRGFDDMAYYVGSGGDYPENPYEGMLASLRDSRNRMEEPGFAEDGKEVFRIMMMVTDEIAQQGGTGQSGITRFNAKPDPTTEMGFWHPNFYKEGALYTRDSAHPVKEEYGEMLELKAKGEESMTETEKTRFKKLYNWWGPDTFPDLLPHPGTTEAAEECNRYVYPSAEQVVEALLELNVTPHFLLGSSQKIVNSAVAACKEIGHTIGSDKKKYQECLKEYYPLKMKEGGYPREDMISYAYNGDPTKWEHLADAILSVLGPLSKPIPCEPEPEDTTAVAPEDTTTVAPEDTTAVAPEDTPPILIPPFTITPPTTTREIMLPTLNATIPTTTQEVTIPVPESSGPSIGWPSVPVPSIPVGPPTWLETTTGAVNPTLSSSTQSEVVNPTTSVEATTKSQGGIGGGSTTTTTTTTTEEEGGSNIGVIAGATGGALAGLAAVGLLAYKKLGGALMGGGGHPSLAQDTEQVEVDESPVERETLEEVTMDMFQ